MSTQLSFLYRVEGYDIDFENIHADDAAIMEGMREAVETAVTHLSCPACGESPNATVAISMMCGLYGYWVVEACCPAFADTVRQSIRESSGQESSCTPSPPSEASL